MRPTPDEHLVPWWKWAQGKRPPGWTAVDERRGASDPPRVTRTTCGICRWPIPDEELFDWVTGEPHSDDYREVVIRNGRRIVRTCLRCWFIWPDGHKVFPALGYGNRPGRRPCVIAQRGDDD